MKKLINFFKKITNRNRFVYAQLSAGDQDKLRSELSTGIDDAQNKLKKHSDDASKDIEESITDAKKAIETSRNKVVKEINAKAEKEHGDTGAGGAPSESANADLIAFRQEMETIAAKGISEIDKDAAFYRLKHSCYVDFAAVEAASSADDDENKGESMSASWNPDDLPDMANASLDVKDLAGKKAVEDNLTFLADVNTKADDLINVLEGRLQKLEDINGRLGENMPEDLQSKIMDKMGKLRGFVTKLTATAKKANELYNQKLKVLQNNAAKIAKNAQDEIEKKRMESAKKQSLREAEKNAGKPFTNTDEELVDAYKEIEKQQKLAEEMQQYADALKGRKGRGEGEGGPAEEPAPEPAKPKAGPVAVARAPKKKEDTALKDAVVEPAEKKDEEVKAPEVVAPAPEVVELNDAEKKAGEQAQAVVDEKMSGGASVAKITVEQNKKTKRTPERVNRMLANALDKQGPLSAEQREALKKSGGSDMNTVDIDGERYSMVYDADTGTWKTEHVASAS